MTAAKPATYLGYIACSLDGFIADTDGSVSWLDPFNETLATTGEDGGYAQFIEVIDGLLMGRATFDQVVGWGWPYGALDCFVLTRQDGFTADHVTHSGQIDSLKKAISDKGLRRIWVVGGGQAQRAALDAGMLDRLRVFMMPCLLGDGLPLFTAGPAQSLRLDSNRTLPGGIVQLEYAVKTTV